MWCMARWSVPGCLAAVGVRSRVGSDACPYKAAAPKGPAFCFLNYERSAVAAVVVVLPDLTHFAFSTKALLNKLRKKSRPSAACWRCSTSQAPGRGIQCTSTTSRPAVVQ